MEHFFPDLLITYLTHFRQAFPANNFLYFQGFIFAQLLSSGRKCITRIANVCFFIDKSLSSWEYFLAQSQWNSMQMTEALTQLIVSQLGESLLWVSRCVLAIDTTYVIKSSKRMIGVQRWSELRGSSQKQTVVGHQWAIVGLLAQIGKQIRCFPLMSRLISGKLSRCHWQVAANGETQPVKTIDTAIALIGQLADFIRIAPICVVADAYFAKAPFFNAILEMKLALVTRLRADAVGFLDPVYCGRGRPPLRGEKVKLAQLLHLLPKQNISVDIYGDTTTVNVVVKTLWLRGVLKKVKVVVVETIGKPILLVSTDLNLTAKEVVEIYAARFALEIAIRDLKQQIGFGDYQSTTTLAFSRFTQLCCVALSIGQLMIKNAFSIEATGRDQSAFSQYLPHSFNRFRDSFKRFVLQRILFSKSAQEADLGKCQNDLEAIVRLIC